MTSAGQRACVAMDLRARAMRLRRRAETEEWCARVHLARRTDDDTRERAQRADDLRWQARLLLDDAEDAEDVARELDQPIGGGDDLPVLVTRRRALLAAWALLVRADERVALERQRREAWKNAARTFWREEQTVREVAAAACDEDEERIAELEAEIVRLRGEVARLTMLTEQSQ